MKKITLSALGLLVMTASAFTLHNSQSAQAGIGKSELATNAAYRDGLYLGKLAAEGNQHRIAAARWARVEDREHFAAGYEQAYNTAAAVRATE